MLNIEAGHLKNLVERIEKLEEEKTDISTHIKEVFGEAKSSGYDTKVIKKVLKERKMNKADLAEEEELLIIYRKALGMLPNFDND